MNKKAVQKRKSAVAEYANAHPICTFFIGLSTLMSFYGIISAIQSNKSKTIIIE